MSSAVMVSVAGPSPVASAWRYHAPVSGSTTIAAVPPSTCAEGRSRTNTRLSNVPISCVLGAFAQPHVYVYFVLAASPSPTATASATSLITWLSGLMGSTSGSLIVASQTEHFVPFFEPASEHVGATAGIATASPVCVSDTGMSVCATSSASHSVHTLPSVRPGSLHVAGTPAITSTTWFSGFTSMGSCSTVSPQTEQTLPSVSPGVVHVGATAASVTT